MKKPLHIIIDGSDKRGKTTVCKLLSQALQIPIIKMLNTKDYILHGTTEEFSRLFNETVAQFKDSDFILDRGYPSSMVYSKVFSRSFDLGYIDQVERDLDPEVFIIHGKSLGIDDVYDKSEIDEINTEFIHFAATFNLPLICVDGKTPEEVAKEILEKL